MKFTIATKQEMTQFSDENGILHPATILHSTGVVVSQIKNQEKDGYQAIQIASIPQKKERVSKSVLGHTGEAFKILKEFKGDTAGYEKGQVINIDVFQVGDEITLSSISKGKGFQGVVKRHGFKGQWKGRGAKHSFREPGSIGGGGRAGGRVARGMRMGGRMGGDKITLKKVKILDIDLKNGLILVKGAVAGHRGSIVEITQK